MNWIILIIASLFEIGFATSLGKLKTATGNAYMMWFGTFVICLVLSVYLLYKATHTLPVGTAYAVWTGLRCGWNCHHWDLCLQGARHFLAYVFSDDPDCVYRWIKDCFLRGLLAYLC